MPFDAVTDPMDFRLCALPSAEEVAATRPDYRELQGQLASVPASKAGDDYERILPELTPISNQQRTGMCVLHASCAAFEYVNALDTGKPPVQLSEPFGYYNSRLSMGGDAVHLDEGTDPLTALDSFTRDGACPAKLWPFDPETVFIPPTEDCYVAASSNKLASYYRITTFDEERIADIIHALESGFPVVFATAVGDDWMRYRSSDHGDAPFTIPTKSRGRHMMVWWGYRRRGGRFAAWTRNSWGREWGIGGYGWMDQDYVRASITTDIWVPTHLPPVRAFAQPDLTSIATAVGELAVSTPRPSDTDKKRRR